MVISSSRGKTLAYFAATTAFRDKFKAIAAGPHDERLHGAFAVGPNGAAPKGAVYVVSHVDVPPPRKDDVIAALHPLAEAGTVPATRIQPQLQNEPS